MEKPRTLRPQRHVEAYPMASVTGAITNNVNWKLCERTAVARAALAARLRKSSEEIGKEIGVQRESTGQQRLWLPEFPENIKPAALQGGWRIKIHEALHQVCVTRVRRFLNRKSRVS